jgi:hypothetical protein
MHCSFLFGLMHTCQVAVYLFVDTILYLDALPRNTSCSCSQDECSCFVPQLMKHVILTRAQTESPEQDVASWVDMKLHEENEMQELQDHLKLVSAQYAGTIQ